MESDPIGLFGGLDVNAARRSLDLSDGLNTYAYVRGNPLSRFDATGLLDKKGNGGGDGGGEGSLCPLISQIPLVAAVGSGGPSSLSVWLCVYDCNTTCPGSWRNLHTEIQWDVWPHTGCHKHIMRSWANR